MITLALSKGRIFDDILPLLKSAGIEVLDDPEKSRKLILDTNQPDLRVVLVREGFDYAAAVKQGSRLKVATKYVEISRDFFASKGVHVDLIKLYGSMELAPLTGLADAIVDLVSTGNTLKANHLIEVERIMDISSHLVVNQTALKLKQAPIRKLIDAFALALAKPLTP